VNEHRGKIDAIRRELDGKVCTFCGSDKYHLVLRSDGESQPGGIYADCSECNRTRGVDETSAHTLGGR
jgi:hypothetical protein